MELLWLVDEVLEISKIYHGKIFIQSLHQFTLNHVTVGSCVSVSIQLQPHVR